MATMPRQWPGSGTGDGRRGKRVEITVALAAVVLEIDGVFPRISQVLLLAEGNRGTFFSFSFEGELAPVKGR